MLTGLDTDKLLVRHRVEVELRDPTPVPDALRGRERRDGAQRNLESENLTDRNDPEAEIVELGGLIGGILAAVD